MTRKVFLILLALMLAVSVGLVACTTAEQEEEEEEMVEWNPYVHGEVTFSQLEWLEEPGVARYPYSNVGVAEFTFDESAGDYLLDEVGGGYLNIVIYTTSELWAVRNLYLAYPGEDYLYGSSPSVQFSLGLDNETHIEELEAAVFLSSEPLEEQPEAEGLWYAVDRMPYLVGGMEGGGSSTWDVPLTIGAFNGSSATVGRNESIHIPVANLAKIDEGRLGCAPGSAARSIRYLGTVHDFTTDDPQTIYDDLVVQMKTQIGTNGTLLKNFTPGKDSYCASKNFSIDSEFVAEPGFKVTHGRTAASWNALIREVQNALKDKCDVEIQIGSYNRTGTNWTRIGGHTAMVTFVANHADGSATIRCVDDPHQGDGMAQNNEWEVSAHNTTWFKDGSHRAVDGFYIQCVPLLYDGLLKDAIREKTGIWDRPIYASDLAGLTSLDASGIGIMDIRGLEYCINLESLDLGYNQIEDISSLANLTSLSVVSLSSNQITDIWALADLTNLTELSLCCGNQIIDISPLASLTNLTELNLCCGNQITDVSPLANLTSLTWLGLCCGNQISDISPLAENEGLGTGDYIGLGENPLSSDSINVYIPELEARGVNVDY